MRDCVGDPYLGCDRSEQTPSRAWPSWPPSTSASAQSPTSKTGHSHFSTTWHTSGWSQTKSRLSRQREPSQPISGTTCTRRGCLPTLPPHFWINSIIFCFLFGKRSLICLNIKSLTPYWGSYNFLPFFQAIEFVWVSDPLRAFLSWY